MKTRNKELSARLWCAACLLAVFCLLTVPSVQTDAQTGSTVWAWGSNDYGELGDGTTTGRFTPVQVKGPDGVGYLTSVVAVSIGIYHNLALRSDGMVWAWGNNDAGGLGDGTTSAHYTPVQVKGPEGAGYLTDISAVSTGHQYSLALRSDGTVWAWGANDHGELGDGTTTGRFTPVQVKGPEGAGYLTDVIVVSTGHQYSLALRSDGTVWAWGYNGHGQLGDGTTSERHTPVQVKGPEGAGYLTDVSAVSSGETHSIALRSDGTVWAWGYNREGEIGDGTDIDSYTPVQVKGPYGAGYLTDVVAISTGGNWGDTWGGDHNLALRSDGTVWTWGYGYWGQLGDGTQYNHWTPVQVKGPDGIGDLTDVVAIATGFLQSLALKSDGTVWAWGYGADGQLGDGTGRNFYTPVQVRGPNGADYLSNVVAIAASTSRSFALIPEQMNVLVSGTVTLEGSARQAQPLFFGFQPVAGGQSFFRSLVLDANGTFNLNDIPRNRYSVWIKGTKWLAKSVQIDTRQGEVTDVNMLLLAGDANNDNSVDVLDLDRLIAAFDSAVGGPNWNEGADLNCDGVVDVLDLNLLIQNFNMVGDF